MDDLWVRPMKTEDIDDVLEIEKLCFSTPWSFQSFKAEIEGNYCARYVVAEQGGRVKGYGGMWIILDEAHITNVAVHPDYRGIGIGEAIMKALIKTAVNLKVDGMTLEVRVSNKIAQNLYEKLGFTGVGIRKGYYTDNGEDALIMWKERLRKQ
ncbi:MAG: ribosomal protein S18-alanine N-acetyltransferase [Clostridiales bacterium]|nr:ribosomal protein S18-alanine N-acetyltransferase [Clostridiales bacterium]